VATEEKSSQWEVLGALRFVLAFVVMCVHLTWYSAPGTWPYPVTALGGKAAVIGFLLISGYSIAASLERQRVGFYRRRLLRIYPLYLASLLFTAAIALHVGPHLVLPNQTLDRSGPITYLGNLLLLQTFVVKPVAYNGPVWSLAVEVSYYLIAPLLSRLDGRLLYAAIICSFVGFMLPKHADRGIVYLVLSKTNAINYFWAWGLGFMLWSRSNWAVISLALIGIAIVFLGPATQDPLDAVTYTVSLGLILSAHRIHLSKRLGQIGRYLGDISYPLYLFHFPTLIIVYEAFGTRSPALLTAAALLASIAAFHFVDRFLKHRLLPQRRSAAPIAERATRAA
jgi:peptidoglycan/LPS O-acetylase OafA/YrhL